MNIRNLKRGLRETDAFYERQVRELRYATYWALFWMTFVILLLAFLELKSVGLIG